VTRSADRIDVPGYFFASGTAIAELDAKHRLVANNPGPYTAELPKFELPAGTWELSLDTNGVPSGVTFRCDGVSAAETGTSKLSISLDAPRAVVVVVGAAAKGVVGIRSGTFVRSAEPAGFRCSPPGDRVTVPLAQLSKRKEARSDWAQVSNVLFKGAGVRVVLPQLSYANAVEISVDGNDRYQVLFVRGSQVEAQATIENGRKGGLSVEKIDVPEPARTTGFDRVELVPSAGDGYYSIGHLTVLAE
jgi:hypothetical protein